MTKGFSKIDVESALNMGADLTNTFKGLNQIVKELRLTDCIKTVMQVLETGHGLSSEVIIKVALSEIEKVKDIL